MALTQAQIAWCAAVLGAGTAGYHAPPVVQKAKAHVAKGKPATSHKRPVNVRKAPVSDSPAPIMDCPLPSVPSFDEGLEYRLDPLWSQPWPPTVWAQGPIAGGRPPFSPSVPEPDAWVMLIAGFGLVGASLRKKGTEHGRV